MAEGGLSKYIAGSSRWMNFYETRNGKTKARSIKVNILKSIKKRFKTNYTNQNSILDSWC